MKKPSIRSGLLALTLASVTVLSAARPAADTQPPARLRFADPVTRRKALVAGKDMLPFTAGRGVAETRLVSATLRHRHAMRRIDIGNPIGFHTVADRSLEFFMHTPDEALPVAEAAVFGVEPAIDEVRH